MIKPLNCFDRVSTRRLARKIAKGMKNCPVNMDTFDKYELVTERLKVKCPRLVKRYFDKIYNKNPHEASFYYEQAFKKASSK